MIVYFKQCFSCDACVCQAQINVYLLTYLLNICRSIYKTEKSEQRQNDNNELQSAKMKSDELSCCIVGLSLENMAKHRWLQASWRFDVVVTALGASTKLLDVGPGL